MKIKMKLNTKDIGDAIKQVEKYNKTLELIAADIVKELAELGYQISRSIVYNHVFTGDTLNSIKVEEISPTKYVLSAESQAILFLEFGAGAKMGYGHPLASSLGMGPGTYPGKGHWNDPNGWWFETKDPRLIRKAGLNGKTYGHSYGNPPRMPFFQASKTMREQILEIALGVICDYRD